MTTKTSVLSVKATTDLNIISKFEKRHKNNLHFRFRVRKSFY